MYKIGIYFLVLILLTGGTAIAQKKKKKRERDIQNVVQTAYSYKGTPYKYGGSSKKGIDCSALVQNSFASAGYKIPRTAQAQS
ncbi:MAG: NlpC/P60 family protein, partial [Reichenbachiella sp.]